MKVVLSQTGDFTRAKGKEVMEAFLKSPEGKNITVLYAHNDDMALGAIQAIEAAGLKPGKEITIVSIDGVKAAFEAMADGKLNCTVECNPMIGPQVFDLVEKVAAKQAVPKRVDVQGRCLYRGAGKGCPPQPSILRLSTIRAAFPSRRLNENESDSSFCVRGFCRDVRRDDVTPRKGRCQRHARCRCKQAGPGDS